MKRYFKDCPHLQECIDKGNLFYYDCAGYTRTLEDHHKSKIKEVEEKLKCKVVTMLQTSTEFGLMESYVLIDEDEPYVDKFDDGSTGVLAYVVSTICEEAGSIGIKEDVGRLFRVW
jgi:hypothetical protein